MLLLNIYICAYYAHFHKSSRIHVSNGSVGTLYKYAPDYDAADTVIIFMCLTV